MATNYIILMKLGLNNEFECLLLIVFLTFPISNTSFPILNLISNVIVLDSWNPFVMISWMVNAYSHNNIKVDIFILYVGCNFLSGKAFGKKYFKWLQVMQLDYNVENFYIVDYVMFEITSLQLFLFIWDMHRKVLW